VHQINKIDDWENKWRIETNESKSARIKFILRNQTCPTVKICNVELPQKNEVKYLGMHLDTRLTWTKHKRTKRKQLNLKSKQMQWLLGRSTISTEKQTPPLQSSTQTQMDLWDSAMGDSL
jgi:hypothetical protein